MTEEQEIHEGTIQIMVYCKDPNDSEYRCSTRVDEEQITRLNLHEGDIVKYKTIDQGAEIVGIVSIREAVKKITGVFEE